MKRSHFIIVFAIILVALPSSFCFFTVDDLFKNFLAKFNKSYLPGTFEYFKRLTIFKSTLKRINWLNSKRSHDASAWYGITEFSDLTPEEFTTSVVRKHNRTSRHHKSRRSVTLHEIETFKNVSGLPSKWDWRDKNVVSPVKDQDKCGACWAFSTIQTMETMQALKTGNLTELSVQQLIDCAREDNSGCDGGDTCSVLSWLSKNKVHVVNETEYPLTDKTGKCNIENPPSGVRIADNYTCDNFSGDEMEMLKVLASHGPLIVAVDATSWQDYLGGIVQFHCERNRNHAVQIIGYDLTGEIPYYIVRNSWGSSFGDNGYIYVAIGKDLCAISEEVSYIDVL